MNKKIQKHTEWLVVGMVIMNDLEPVPSTNHEVQGYNGVDFVVVKGRVPGAGTSTTARVSGHHTLTRGFTQVIGYPQSCYKHVIH